MADRVRSDVPAAPPHSHVVSVYDDDSDIVTEVARYVADGLAHGERVIVVATAAHRADIDDILVQFGTDASRARIAGRYLTFDAAETLVTFMADGRPDPVKFARQLGSLVDAAAEDGCPVRVFGEMVALLWEDGNVSGAIELEALWNALSDQRRFSLLCAYPEQSLGTAPLSEANRVCSLHSGVLEPRSYLGGGPSLEQRATAHRMSKVFVPVTSAIPAARRFVDEVLRSWGEHQLQTDAAVITSELATNAVSHAASAFCVHVVRDRGAVRITIEDMGPARPQPRDAAPEDFGGRGMMLVDRLSRQWGCDAADGAKRVWAELASQQTNEH
jgi:anti-sigma regulatory factor (Ser/Thr protein kinase)